MTRSIDSVNVESSDRPAGRDPVIEGPDVGERPNLDELTSSRVVRVSIRPDAPIGGCQRPAKRRRSATPLPAVKAVTARGLAPTDGGSDEPEQGEDHRHDPQDMEGETSPGEDQHDEEQEEQEHVGIVPAAPGVKRKSENVLRAGVRLLSGRR
jgi:hypothetical protein